MYGPSYGFGSPPADGSSPFIHPHQPHQQQQGQQGQQGQQLPQHMMYHPQAYGAPPQQPMYDASGMAAMGGSPEGMAMTPQQDAGMANVHLPGEGAQYQTPYTSTPYGVSIPSASSNLPANYFPASSPGNAAPRPLPMNQQPMNQRIQPPSAQNRTSPYGNMQSTPPHATGAHPQFAATGQGQNANQSLQQPGSNPHVGGAVTTPQTPVFPPSQQGQTAQGNAQMATPLSPGSESREKERVTLLLEINRELLLAVIELQSTQQAEKKEGAAAAASSTPTDEKDKAEKEKAEKAKASSGREYVECMRRLQSNLAYLAAIADRAHKPSSQIPAHPAIMSAPPLALHLNPTADATNTPKADADGSETKKEEGEAQKDTKEESKGLGGETRGERIETLREQYKRLQALFPDADPKKDPPIQRISEASRQQMHAKAQAQAHAQAQAQAQAAAGGQSG